MASETETERSLLASQCLPVQSRLHNHSFWGHPLHRRRRRHATKTKGKEAKRGGREEEEEEAAGRASEGFCIVRRSCIVNGEREREFAAPCSRFLIYCSAASLRPRPLDGMSPNFPSFGKGRSLSSPFRHQVIEVEISPKATSDQVMRGAPLTFLVRTAQATLPGSWMDPVYGS